MNETGSWLASSRRRIFLDMHLPAWEGKGIAESFDPRRLADSMADAGADSVVLFAKCQYGNFYTTLSGEKLHPGLKGMDFLEETSAALKARGIRVLAYYSVSWDERLADQHSEWLAADAAGNRGKGPGRWRTLCINGPYADLVERHLAEISRKPIDGIWLDMTIVGDGYCHCPRCRAAFAAQWGREPPVDPRDPRQPELVSFRCNVVESFHARMRAAVRAAAPTVEFTNNYWGYPWSSMAMGSRALGATAQADFVTGEAYSDWTGIRSVAMLPVFLRGVARGRPFEALIGTGVNTWDYTRKPRAYLAFEAFSVFAHGATITVDDQPFADGRIDDALYREDLKEIFRETAAAGESVAGVPSCYAAVYHSQATRERCAEQPDFVKDVSGAFRLFRDMALPVEFMFDERPADIPAGCRLILLPGVAELSGAQWSSLESFMTAGGVVLASGGLGGDPVVRGALGRLGIEGGARAQWSISYLRAPGAPAARGRDILVRGRYGVYSPGPRLPHGAAQGEVINPICETGPREFFHNNLPAPHEGSGVPAFFDVPVGRGALILFPQPVTRHYAKEPSRPLRELIRSLVSRRLPPPRIELVLPKRVDFEIMESPDAIHVHLLNPSVEPSLCCGLMDIYEGAFERSFEYMEEEVPVHDLRILVRRDRIGRVSASREGSAVEVRQVAEGWEIRVARVALWEVVRIELGVGEWLSGGAWTWR